MSLATSPLIDNDFELELFLAELNEEEAHCESDHSHPENLVCSEEVTHRLRTGCGLEMMVCTNTANYIVMAKKNNRGVCAHCRKRTANDWNVYPI